MSLVNVEFFKVATVLYFYIQVFGALTIKTVNETTGIRNNIHYSEAENCTTFDINCMERQLTGKFWKGDKDNNSWLYQCSLRNIKRSIFWWANPNGSLTFSSKDRDHTFLDLSFRQVGNEGLYNEIVRTFEANVLWNVKAFSAAGNNLTTIPYEALRLINDTLVYLNLKGNNFSRRIRWLIFPQLANLRGLDLSNCNIRRLHEESFRNLTKLESLLISNNNIIEIDSNTFFHLRNLRHLDISQIENFIPNDEHEVPTVEAYFSSVFEGINIAEFAFVALDKLEYLDFSYTKIARSGVKAFAHLGHAVKYLSLCFTSIPIIGKAIFSSTSLKALDLSGNGLAAYHIGEESFEGIDDTLQYLAFEKSNIKSLEWLKKLRNLKILKLGGNNINDLKNETFDNLNNLQLLDLSSNHIGNWYYRVFEQNQNLMVLNMRENNINLISPQMFSDFSGLAYLAIGRNNFVCDCVLRNVIDVAAENNKAADCIRHIMRGGLKIYRPINAENPKSLEIDEHALILGEASFYWPFLEKSHVNMLKTAKLHTLTDEINKDIKHRQENAAFDQCKPRSENSTNLSFQLLDYTDSDYWCFNSSQYLELIEVTKCSQQPYSEEVEQTKKKIQFIVYGSIFAVSAFTILLLAYYKKWYIRYYFFALKNSATLKFYLNKKGNLRHNREKFTYDIFVSYSDNDREWVLEELLPNVEDIEQVAVCLHERDFQVGITILENIISCMDKSRCVVLVVSKSFLSSQWCLFELNLAQNRLFDMKPENLILILLEDIPKLKRPNTLQYLMHLKTYIKWPTPPTNELTLAVAEERKLFWKRLNKSLVDLTFSNQRMKI